MIRVDQQPLGTTPTSNPVTYTGAFDPIRQLFAQMPESKLRGYTQRRFSFQRSPVDAAKTVKAPGNNVSRCTSSRMCGWSVSRVAGIGTTEETLDVLYKGHSISAMCSNLTCGEGLELFANVPKIRRILQTLCDVGLDYLTWASRAPTLSGGEAQRVKLASELSRPDTGRTLYLLDEPTTGLHFG